jgi:hypothetical protein
MQTSFLKYSNQYIGYSVDRVHISHHIVYKRTGELSEMDNALRYLTTAIPHIQVIITTNNSCQ